ncbi:MAG TPA: hypothetical protein VK439_00040, partial [Rubrivivax sp.]|nr:hypothetical protein [Rubrivivax sp.]
MLDETLPPARDHEATPEPATHGLESVVPQVADEPVAHGPQAPADATDAGDAGSHQSDTSPGVETTVETS